MDKFKTSTGRVSHIVTGVADAPVESDDRLVIMACGKQFLESELTLDTDSKTCVKCDKAVS